ncbi:50S ribosomal protein L29 [Candidatus Saccharibacteria bacterium]|nr:50S ribosomal protein L29 [Candidatus Saccharibacteria bacterium]
MAEKKIDKKATKKAAKEAEVIKTLPLPEQLAKKREELLAAQQGLGSTLQNPHAIKNIKKDIARILTKINASKGDK